MPRAWARRVSGSGPRSRRPFVGAGNDRGAVTVEAALALCSLVLVLVFVVSAVTAAGAQLRCIDAAREPARLVARGEPERARRAVESIAPDGARVEIRVVGDEVTVEVSSKGAGRLPGLTVSGRALGVLEPAALRATSSGDQPGATSKDPAADRLPATAASSADDADGPP